MRSEVAVQGFPSIGLGAGARSGWLRAWVAALFAGTVVALGCAAVLQTQPDGASAPTAMTRDDLTSLPLVAQGPVSVALGRGDPTYQVEDMQAVNPAQRFRTKFSSRGVTVASGAARLGITLDAYGHGTALRPVNPTVPRARVNRVTYARGAVTESYANGPLGIEQGFAVAARHGPGATGPLTLSLALFGNLTARKRNGSVLLAGRGAELRYGGLVAIDARGEVLRSRLELGEGHVLIRVSDRHATYPVRIDPLIQQGPKLVGTGAIGRGRFGYSVALSGDGDTALIGARYGSSDTTETGIGTGAAWVFVRSGGAWTQQGGKLVGTGHAGEGEFAHVAEGEFGRSVALSGDGDTAFIGAPRDNDGGGAVWVFTRSGSTWTQQGEKLTGTGEVGGGEFGTSVAVSGDGDTALIGGPGDDDDLGAAWVFTRSGSTWAQQGAKFTDAGETEAGRFGSSVALSGDGGTALIGAPRDEFGVGAAWAFTRSAGVWTQQGAKLTGGGEAGEGEFGSSVALAADGDTALVGGLRDNNGQGAAWAFMRSGSTWIQQGEKLTGTGAIGAGRFGSSVALSPDGGTALIGGPEDDGAIGAGWAFTRSGGTWAQQGTKLTGREEDNAEQGVLVSLSADGNTALVGGWNDDRREGAAWVFVRSDGVWTQQGPKLTADEEEGREGFGTSVALSADGDTALIGEPGNENRKGAVWVFTRSGSTWTQQGEKLTPAGTTGNPWFGYTVAISGDGQTALVGGWLDDGWKGAVWVFARSGSTWTQQAKLTAADEIGEAMFGTNVALSADGDTALIGGWNDDSVLRGDKDYSGQGAAWIFTRTGSTWGQQGPKLTPADLAGNGKFGTIVALSADGSTALIGGWNDDTSKGAAWVFTRSGAAWNQQGQKLIAADESGEGRFGVSAALSADGNIALVGGLADDGDRGAAWLFRRSGSTWIQQGEKITGTDQAGESEFGTNVALSADGATALIGGWRDNGGTGAAWVFVQPPSATTGVATAVGQTSATLNGTRGAGGAGTAYFQYGTTAAYGVSTPIQGVGTSGEPSPVAASISGLEPGTTYHFRLIAENSGGVHLGGDQTFTTDALGSTPERPPSPPGPGEQSMAPVLSHLRQSAARWRAGNRLARVNRARVPIGTTFSFSLDQQATVAFSFAQRVRGRRVGGRCVAQTRRNRREPPCKRTVEAGGLTFAGHGGANRLAFQGRISAAKRLRPGDYRVAITATNSAGLSSAPKSLSFTIVR